ncbi:phosphopantetheine-binding protein [Ruminiclostridium cellulolyticum]|uniref:Phosphopantetheine-binding n=1 Tax=Ruminiclostridium cellulolyticum (strain ATCC 35319 / DSM 5812 / JCM 6584 / H10) TaxID=394503 RepID=B8I5C6_RUMCH|nr:phosphopantetheine-binding protein [Ruminiclostridium cellulolyticum]ACL76662.1 phosphopantetheine-binding [Ruminiclostridium cellulolyticum H10]
MREKQNVEQIEGILTNIWKEVLYLKTLNVNDRFFDLGGDSFKAEMISDICLEKGIQVTPNDIFNYKSISEIAKNTDIIHEPAKEAFKDDKITEKKLKIKYQRDITTYLHRAIPLCAILTEDSHYSWFYEHYIQLFFITYNNNFSRLEFLEPKNNFEEIFDETYLTYKEQQSDIIEFIEKSIDSGKYLTINIDEYYLPQKGSYNEHHYVHQSMVFGYDKTAGKLMALGFDSNMLFKELIFDYDDFVKAYESAKTNYEFTAPWAETEAIQLLTPKRTEGGCKFNLSRFMEEINKYLDGSESDSSRITKLIPLEEQQMCTDIIYGPQICNAIVESLEKLGRDIVQGLDVQGMVEQFKEKMRGDIMPAIDYRSIHLLYEHKKGLYDRFKYISNNYYTSTKLNTLLEEFNKQVDKLNTARLTFFDLEHMLRFNFDPATISFENIMISFQKVIDTIKSVGDEEEQLLRDICMEFETGYRGGK